jgi:hypothetical protein
MPVPSKWSIRIGPPVVVPGSADVGADTLELAETVRRQVDGMIADLLLERRSIIFG